MKSVGMVRQLDEVGRIVLPKELRRTFGIDNKDSLEIYVEGDNIILRKYEPGCLFCGSADDVITYEDRRICKECIEKMNSLK